MWAASASGVLSRDCDSYWNSAVTSSGPWNLTIDTGTPISPTGFEYSIFVPDEAPLAFAVEASAMEFDKYAPMPRNLQEEVIAAGS